MRMTAAEAGLVTDMPTCPFPVVSVWRYARRRRAQLKSPELGRVMAVGLWLNLLRRSEWGNCGSGSKPLPAPTVGETPRLTSPWLVDLRTCSACATWWILNSRDDLVRRALSNMVDIKQQGRPSQACT